MPEPEVPRETPAQVPQHHLPGLSDPSDSPLLLRQGTQSPLQPQDSKNPNLIRQIYCSYESAMVFYTTD